MCVCVRARVGVHKQLSVCVCECMWNNIIMRVVCIHKDTMKPVFVHVHVP